MKLKGQLRDAIHGIRTGYIEMQKLRSELKPEHRVSHHMSLGVILPWYNGIAVMKYIAKQLKISTKTIWKIYYNKNFTT